MCEAHPSPPPICSCGAKVSEVITPHWIEILKNYKSIKGLHVDWAHTLFYEI